MVTIGLYIIGGTILSTFFTLFYLEDRDEKQNR